MSPILQVNVIVDCDISVALVQLDFGLVKLFKMLHIKYVSAHQGRPIS